MHHKKDRKCTTLQQMFTGDPTVVDIDKLRAHMADGVLAISAPKI